MAEKRKADKAREPDFEHALDELEELVVTMERGDMGLEQSLKSFERGVELTRLCRDKLQQAEQRIEILAGNSEQAKLEPFDNDA